MLKISKKDKEAKRLEKIEDGLLRKLQAAHLMQQQAFEAI
jgi:hypothetical protein